MIARSAVVAVASTGEADDPDPCARGVYRFLVAFFVDAVVRLPPIPPALSCMAVLLVICYGCSVSDCRRAMKLNPGRAAELAGEFVHREAFFPS